MLDHPWVPFLTSEGPGCCRGWGSLVPAPLWSLHPRLVPQHCAVLVICLLPSWDSHPACWGQDLFWEQKWGQERAKGVCGSRALPVLAGLRQAAALGAADTVQVLFALETGPVPDKGTCLLCGSM